ncbi:hypothetical protein JCM3775_001921 [Rhodotorula graminis]|uniref:JmjC domain-containing histone demethylation protein 1 n=1 Tax=Rhodotorula graminis (strain WP1) TaxID=578459 RepID=A0A0P9F7R6_RHOGW|nr:uncharacterized protein RHOBADRAFT_56351 [Rhodotorula graminis WP1]KPV71728.1 hypothetical protein RHOBADRAFT_56351 [Rhodotorula graminis WP1]
MAPTGRTTAAKKRAAAAPPPAGSTPARPRRAASDKKQATKASPTSTKPKKLAPARGKPAVTAEPDPSGSPPDLAPVGDNTAAKPPATAAEADTESDKPRPRSPQKTGPAPSNLKSDQDADECPACSSTSKGDSGTWVECDECEKWYHWTCVASTSADSPDNIDKASLSSRPPYSHQALTFPLRPQWYCASCVAASASSSTPLRTTYILSPLSSLASSRSSSPALANAPPTSSTTASTTASAPPPPPPAAAPPAASANLRKSSRSTRAQGIDYANLDAHLPASVDRWSRTISAREASGAIVDGFTGEGAFRRFEDGHELSREGDEWVYGDKGMTEPFVVVKEDGLGLKMPRHLTVKQVAELVGPKTPLEVIDCASQSSLANWTLGQWADYYEDPGRDKVRNVISLEVSDSRLGEMVTAPELVRKLDWVDTVWPEDMKVPGQYPRVQKYCLMSVSRCWTDWHVDFAGSSVFYHVLRGGKTFFFIRPTPANLQAYEQWSGSSERQEQTWLGDMCDQVYRMDLVEGNTAFIPTGWIHAVYTPADSLVIGGNFLHSLNIPTQLRVYNIELATKVPRKFRYPHFVKLLWLVGKHYNERLSSHPAGEPLPLPLRAPRVLEGLKELSSFLIEQTTRLAKGAQVSAERRRLAKENIPHKKVPDPVWLSRELRKVVLQALGEPLDAECYFPHVAHIDESADHALAPGNKRKADSPLELDANAALAALSRANKVRRPSSSAAVPSSSLPGAGAFPAYMSPSPSSGAADADGEIIGRHTLPVQTVTRTEERIDPRGAAAKNGALSSEVRESRSTASVVRRWEHDPLDSSGAGGPVVETRTVITIVERVRFPSAAQAKVQAQQRRGQSFAPPPQPEQHAGIGPPAPLSVTAIPGTPLPHVGATNPQPYQPHGWPYQYELLPAPSGGGASSNGLPALPSSALGSVGAVPPPGAMLPPPVPSSHRIAHAHRPRTIPSAVTTSGLAHGRGEGLPTPPPTLGPGAARQQQHQFVSAYPPPPALLPAPPGYSSTQGAYPLPLPLRGQAHGPYGGGRGSAA